METLTVSLEVELEVQDVSGTEIDILEIHYSGSDQACIVLADKLFYGTDKELLAELDARGIYSVTELENAICTEEESAMIYKLRTCGIDSLAKLEKAISDLGGSEPKIAPMSLSFSEEDSSITIVNNEEVKWEVFGEEMVEFKPVMREEEIDNLITWLSESKSDSDKLLMKADLKMLLSWEDEYVFSSISTNKYVSPTHNPQEFNAICAEILRVKNTLLEKEKHMTVANLIDQLRGCNPDATIEIRGNVEEGYLCEKNIAVDNNGSFVVLDI